MDVLGPEADLRIVRDISRREVRPAIAGQLPMAIEVLCLVFLLSVHLDGHSHVVCADRRLDQVVPQ
jgi:hypothetical protein